MIDELLRDRERPGSDITEPPITVQTAPRQLLTGQVVGLPTGRVVCIDCGVQLQEGRAVTVYAYRVAENQQWDLQRCYCEDCAPASVAGPTLGVTELLAKAWLGTLSVPRTRTHEVCLTEIEVVAYSPPEEGCEP